MARWSERFMFRGVLYINKYIPCGKEACTKCPHGPYWYAQIDVGAKKKIHRYIGKHLKGAVAEHYRLNYRGGKAE